MDSLHFWLHMDGEFMWRWWCFDANRTLVAHSTEWFFSRDDAEAAIVAAKLRMIQAAAA
jgi:uncharacterized protein YegP (UPF0339 family)